MNQPSPNIEPNPVDDVRSVRARLDRETQGDLHALAEQSQAAVERYRDSLQLHIIPAPHPDAPGERQSA